VWNFKGDTYIPDFDMYVWDWAGYSDPGQTLSAEIAAQIGNTNEPCWSNAEYDTLNGRQAATLDANARKAVIWRMQQIMYEQTPWVVLSYPQYLEAYNTAKWTGWVRMNDGKGPAFLTTGNVQSYVDLKPQTVAATSSRTGIWIAVAAAAVVVLGLLVWLIKRRRPRAEEA
jgi:peptide/nickel transport system substrate-binding protein